MSLLQHQPDSTSEVLSVHPIELRRTQSTKQVLTPKFCKESDLWVRFEKESVWWKEGYFQRFSAKRSAVGYLLQFDKETVELILRDWTVTWLNQGDEWMDRRSSLVRQ
jgi:hypothetical protein